MDKTDMNVLKCHEVRKQVVRMTRHVSCQNRFRLTACPDGQAIPKHFKTPAEVSRQQTWMLSIHTSIE